MLRTHGCDAVIRVGEEILEAQREGRGVVALETTLVAHGFPPGEGVEVGLASERAVRDGGAVPATVGVLDGEVVVGLTEGELGALRRSTHARSARATSRAAVVQRAPGATTVGGTLAVVRGDRNRVHGDRRARRRASRLARAARRLCRPPGARAARACWSSPRA